MRRIDCPWVNNCVAIFNQKSYDTHTLHTETHVVAPRLVGVELNPGPPFYTLFPNHQRTTPLPPNLNAAEKYVYDGYERFIDHTTANALVTLVSALSDTPLQDFLKSQHPISVAFDKLMTEEYGQGKCIDYYGAPVRPPRQGFQPTPWTLKVAWLQRHMDLCTAIPCTLHRGGFNRALGWKQKGGLSTQTEGVKPEYIGANFHVPASGEAHAYAVESRSAG